MDSADRGEQIRVRGLVQGVGFRPTVWRLANECGLRGEVWNDAEGVMIQIWGEPARRDRFVAALESEIPPLARIDAIERLAADPGARVPVGFSIVESREGEVRTGIVPDAATCEACVSEVFDPDNRRYRYPFTNCTHCGPRLSIVRSIPYDRATTSMSVFPMCPECGAEYADPADRRFHAQPNACPVCGPRLRLENGSGEPVGMLQGEDEIAATVRLLRQGEIVAIKGIGGVHLACDASNRDAVDRLRRRKRRYHKAFALMARNSAMVEQYAELNTAERETLRESAAPIVVLNARCDTGLAPGVAPGQNTLGFMLPYTPMHHLLMAGIDHPIVLTSGNRSDEPQCIGDDEAHNRLHSIADYWLLHDREIVNRLDDSVVRFADGEPRKLRRARGYAPEPLLLPPGFGDLPPILAMGGELKNTFCLLQDGRAIVSQHMGDLEDAATHLDYRRNLALYEKLYDHQPGIIAVDRHPNYLSTQWGRERAAEQDLELIEVQHHQAHIAACMVERGMDMDSPAVLGIAMDGLGFGEDGTIWGGEFFRCDYRRAERLASFLPVEMIGGSKAIYEPWRNTFAHLEAALGWESLEREYAGLELVSYLEQKPRQNLMAMMQRGLNCPLASSAGRLFDAAAAALGICREQASHEGQAAIELEALAQQATLEPGDLGYDVELIEREGLRRLTWAALWRQLLTDLAAGVEPAVIAARFHRGVINGVASVGQRLCDEQGLNTVVLSGGVFQNRILLEGVSEQLRASGLEVMSPSLYPANDGGISLGQAVVAAARWNHYRREGRA